MPGNHLQTERQRRRLETLPAGHKVINTRYGALVVRCPDGHLLRVKPNGRLVPLAPIQRIQSYLQLNG